jgi:cell wall-associated NlpC family hydrolase
VPAGRSSRPRSRSSSRPGSGSSSYLGSRPARAALALCTVAVTAAVATPTPAGAVPGPDAGLSLDEVKLRVAALDRQAEVAAEAYNGAQEEVRAVEQRLVQYQATAQRQQAKVAEMQDRLGLFAAAQYRAGGLDATLQTMLSKNPEQFLQQAATLSQLTDQQSAAIRSVETEQQKLAQDRLVAAQQAQEFGQTHAEARQHKLQVESTLQQAQRLLNSLTEKERKRLEEAQRAARAAQRAEVTRTTRAGSDEPSKKRPDPPPDPRSDPPVTVPPASGRAGAAVAYAKAHLGDSYVWGGAGPHGFDCSGLTMMAWRQAGVSLHHQASQQYHEGRHVPRSALRPGDLVFFYSGISHVGLYIGGGRMIHAANPREDIKIDEISGGYWAGVYVGAARPA